LLFAAAVVDRTLTSDTGELQSVASWCFCSFPLQFSFWF